MPAGHETHNFVRVKMSLYEEDEFIMRFPFMDTGCHPRAKERESGVFIREYGPMGNAQDT